MQVKALRSLSPLAIGSGETNKRSLFGPFEGFVPLSELADLGVTRVSIGSGFSNLAYGSLISASKELLGEGTFGFMKNAASGSTLQAIMDKA